MQNYINKTIDTNPIEFKWSNIYDEIKNQSYKGN